MIIKPYSHETYAEKWRKETEALMRKNGHDAEEIAQAIAAGPAALQTAGSATASERNSPNAYHPPPTILGAGAGPETQKALDEAGYNSLEGELTRATNPAREASEKAGEAVTNAAKSEVPLPNIPNIVTEVGELIKSYGIRLLEIIAGGILILFGLVTLARGGQPPNMPKAVPVPI
jgi:hypothetical protein